MRSKVDYNALLYNKLCLLNPEEMPAYFMGNSACSGRVISCLHWQRGLQSAARRPGRHPLRQILRLLTVLLVLALPALPAAAQRYDARLAAPPAGFAWQPLPAASAALLLPAGWHFRAGGTKAAPSYYLTREPMGESGEFATGLALQVVRRSRAQTHHPAPEYAALLMLRAGFGPGRQRLADTSAVAGPWHRRAVRYREATPDAEPRIIYQLALANARTDTLYLLTFESPEKEWAEAWQLGAVMVREWVLDSRQ